jgi:hypothetical protein
MATPIPTEPSATMLLDRETLEQLRLENKKLNLEVLALSKGQPWYSPLFKWRP